MLPIGLVKRYERIEKEIKENLQQIGELNEEECSQKQGETRERILQLMDGYRYQAFKLQDLQGELDSFLADAVKYVRDTNREEAVIEAQIEEIENSEQGTSYWSNILQKRQVTLKSIVIRLGLILNPIQPPVPYTIPQIPPVTTPAGTPITVNIPQRPEIMKFDGDETMWPLFWNLFDNYINKSDIPVSDKLCQLVSHLEGPARKAIKGIAPIPENYGTMINELQSIYGDNTSIIANLELAMQKLPISPSSYQWVESVREMLGILKQLNNLGEPLNNSKWMRDVICRLPEFIKIEIYANPERYRTIEEIQAFLQDRIKIEHQLSRDRARAKVWKDKLPVRSKPMAQGQTTKRVKQEPLNTWPRTSALLVNTKAENRQNSRRCCFCQMDNHFSSMCKTYPIGSKRIARANLLRLCLKCSLSNHKTEDCKANLRGCRYCGKPHLNMLCPRPNEANIRSSPKGLNTKTVVDNRKEETGVKVSQAKFTQRLTKNREDIILPSILVTVTTVPRSEKKEEVLALLDTGSQNSYILKSLAERLQLPMGIPERFKVETFNDKQPRTLKTEKVEFALYEEGAGKFFMDAYTVDFISSEIQTVNMRSKPTTFKVTDLKEDDFVRMKPSILIGADYCYRIIGDTKNQKDTVRSWNTPFGPVITGCWDKSSKTLWALEPSESEKPVELNALWDLEFIGITDDITEKEDERAYKEFQDTLRINEEGRYAVSWPWINDTPELSDTFGLCWGRLEGLRRKFKKDEELYLQCSKVLQEQLDRGIIEQAPKESNNLIHYLPAQLVCTPEKDTTKLRIVYDASAKTQQGKSLNEALYRGPVILPELCGILLRFRTTRYILTADVEKAFLQIELNETDRDVTRFLWFKDLNQPLKGSNIIQYRFKRVPFGVISSPFLLAAVLKYHLNKYQGELAEIIAKNIYVDNIIIPTNSRNLIQEAPKLAKGIFQDVHMNLRQFASNYKGIKNTVEPEDLTVSRRNKLLGILWDSDDDTITLKTRPLPTGKWTKRNILQFVAKHFDPLGYLAPCLIIWKCILQTLWKNKVDWDERKEQIDELLKELLKHWTEEEITIPRFSFPLNKITQIHVFCDASTKAHAAVIYLRSYERTQIVFVKSRVNPVKGMTVPRAELMAALIGVRAVKYVQNQLDLQNNPVYAWTDAKCVLGWLDVAAQKDGPQKIKKGNRFLHNRIFEIHNTGIEFRYVPTKENPADKATRGMAPSALKKDALWWNGPSWLQQDEIEWPTRETCSHDLTLCIKMYAEDLFDWNRYSNIWRIIRIAKLVIEAKNKWLHINRTVTLQEATDLVIREGQRDITEKEKLDYNLYRDVKDIWRVGSRIKEYKKPVHIYIPSRSPILDLLILDAHERCAHFGTEHTMATFRSNYWTEHARQRIKKVLAKKCYYCRRWRAKQFKLPPMANLPMERTTPCVPFKHTAVDYLGPIQVKGEWTTKKKWICLFTCLTTRAVHLEVADGLSLANFIIVYKQFVARRGEPQTIVSDYGTQFVAAAQVLKPKWKFGTPQAPWQGGVYERLIGLTKTALKKTIGRRLLSEDELRLLTIEIENILNHRPLTYQGEDMDNVLRPVDFLRPSVEDDIDQIGNRTPQLIDLKNKMKECLNNLWKVWSNYYLNSLRERKNRDITQPKATTKRRPRENEIVIVKEPNIPRGMWRIAKITKLLPSNDGRVRTAEIQVGTRKWLRPINLLYPLELELGEDTEQEENDPDEDTIVRREEENLEENNLSSQTTVNLIQRKTEPQTTQSPKEKLSMEPQKVRIKECQTKTSIRKSLFYIMMMFLLITPSEGGKFWACFNKMKGSVMKLPEIRNCSIPDADGIKIQVEMYLRKYHKIPSITCAWTQREVCTKSFLHLTFEVTRDSITQRNLTKEECEILSRDKQLNGIHLHRISENEWTSDQDTQYSYGILGTRCTTTNNYRVTLGAIATADGKGVLTDLVSQTRCQISTGICIIPRGTIIWDPKAGEKLCPFELKGRYKAMVTDGQIIIDELQAVFDYKNGSFKDERCNIEGGIKVDEDIILHKPGVDYTVLKRTLSGRVVVDREITIPNHALATLIQKDIREEIPRVDPQMQYKYRQFRDELADHLIRAYQERCELSNLMVVHILHISEENPTLAARIILQRNDVTAQNVGKGMLVSPCQEVQPEKIYEEHKVNNQCYQDLPIRVGKILMFASLRTGEIKGTSPKIKCEILKRIQYDENGQPTNLLWRTRDSIDRRNFTLKNLQFTTQTFVNLEKQRVQLELEALAGATSQQLIVRHDDVREHVQKTSEVDEMIHQFTYDVEEGVSVAAGSIKDELRKIAMTWLLRIGMVGILIFVVMITIVEIKHQILKKLFSLCNLSNLFRFKKKSDIPVQFRNESEPLVQFKINPEPLSTKELAESGSSSRECHEK